MDARDAARRLLEEWKGESYAFGLDVLSVAGEKTASLGRRALLVANDSAWMAETVAVVTQALNFDRVEVVRRVVGSAANTPLEDVYRIQDAIQQARPDVIVAIGAGSTIDAVKAASVLAALSPGRHEAGPFLGVGQVTKALGGKALIPLVAVETAASSGSHLTKYANVTDMAARQKKLIVDEAIVPKAAVFDYSVTVTAGKDLTCDGAFDGMSHCMEVYFGAKGATLERAEPVALVGVDLIIDAVRLAVERPDDLEAREKLGLGTDLGGYAIMIGSTNGGHLTSFSLVDVTTHGRATAILNPYYAVLFAPAIERQLRNVGMVYRRAGFMDADPAKLGGRELALAVAGAMQALPKMLGYPTSLGEVKGFGAGHIERAVAAAKDPQLRSKLDAMPVPMDAAMVDRYMRPTLEAAAEGRLEGVPSVQ